MAKARKHTVNPIRYILPGAGITHKIIEAVNPSRIIFYSSVLALSSAALAFLGQRNLNDGDYKFELLVVISTIGFGFSILTLLSIYFLHIVHGIYWALVEQYYEKMLEVAPLDNVKDTINHEYFKQNPKDLKRFKDALYISAKLMAVEVRLDLVLLISIFVGVLSYCAKLVGLS